MKAILFNVNVPTFFDRPGLSADVGRTCIDGGFDKVYDTVGHADTLNMALRVTATNGTLSVIGISKEVKLDLTTLWLKLQTVKGCYGYRYNNIEGDRKHAYEMALDLISSEKIRMDGMLTHKFPLIKCRELIDVNVSEGAHRAMKTGVSFEWERRHPCNNRTFAA